MFNYLACCQMGWIRQGWMEKNGDIHLLLSNGRVLNYTYAQFHRLYRTEPGVLRA